MSGESAPITQPDWPLFESFVRPASANNCASVPQAASPALDRTGPEVPGAQAAHPLLAGGPSSTTVPEPGSAPHLSSPSFKLPPSSNSPSSPSNASQSVSPTYSHPFQPSSHTLLDDLSTDIQISPDVSHHVQIPLHTYQRRKPIESGSNPDLSVPLSRSGRPQKLPSHLTDFQLHVIESALTISLPDSIEEAILDRGWKLAMEQELAPSIGTIPGIWCSFLPTGKQLQPNGYTGLKPMQMVPRIS
ncbi:hypothetical protein KC19_VG083600 [Ceratodon purpureus]|uniref:Uncharacterized protein n=1 Tax=Ceratodon purpureus TaxID=3225 RepID=A0A8T0HNC0_CERPU|nr:hypothetical protein KC19_VG083600 [Ceratodon purpureus]